METKIKASMINWEFAEKNTFIPVTPNLFIIKFRDTLVTKGCRRGVPIVAGLEVLDVATDDGYFLGAFINVDLEKWDIRRTLTTLTLAPKYNYTFKTVELIKDDGFIKIYRATNNAIVICCI